ncbi:hypothetical protein GCM10027168_23960 [Streptomyces capparidis]
MSDLRWQKSTFSSAEATNCVEVTAAPRGAVHLRESDAPGTVLTVGPAAFGALIRHLKAGPAPRRRGHRSGGGSQVTAGAFTIRPP